MKRRVGRRMGATVTHWQVATDRQIALVLSTSHISPVYSLVLISDATSSHAPRSRWTNRLAEMCVIYYPFSVQEPCIERRMSRSEVRIIVSRARMSN